MICIHCGEAIREPIPDMGESLYRHVISGQIGCKEFGNPPYAEPFEGQVKAFAREEQAKRLAVKPLALAIKPLPSKGRKFR